MTSKNNEIRFINVRIPDTLLAADDFEELDSTDCGEFLLAFANEGYKVGVGPNADGSAFICSFTCKRSSDANFNLCFTQWAGTPEKAIAKAVYFHEFVCQRGDWESGMDRIHKRE